MALARHVEPDCLDGHVRDRCLALLLGRRKVLQRCLEEFFSIAEPGHKRQVVPERLGVFHDVPLVVCLAYLAQEGDYFSRVVLEYGFSSSAK